MSTSERVSLVVPGKPDVCLVGILEHVSGGTRTRGDLDNVHEKFEQPPRPIALILHGTLGHKDYLYQKKLAKALPLDSFRFDFRGNFESTGICTMGSFADDLEDIKTVTDHLVSRGYVIVLAIGHSRGSFMGFKWLCSTPEGRQLRGYVNVSGRYKMDRLLETNGYLVDAWRQQGYYERKATVARKQVVSRIYPDDFYGFVNWKNDFIWTDCPSQVHILTIHGIADQVVPVYDAVIWADATSSRNPGTHQLHLIEKGDHNLIGVHDEVIQVILDWWQDLQSGSLLSSGIWRTPYRSHL